MIVHEQLYIQQHNELYKKEKGIVKNLHGKIGSKAIVSFKNSHLLCEILGKHPRGSKVKVLHHKFYELEKNELSPLYNHARVVDGFINLEKFNEVADEEFKVFETIFLNYINNPVDKYFFITREMAELIEKYCNRFMNDLYGKIYYVNINEIRCDFVVLGNKLNIIKINNYEMHIL